MSNKKLEKFDWNSKTLTIENCQDKLGDNLMSVLVLPTVDDFRPYLSKAAFPEYLILNPQVCKSAFDEFVPVYEKAIDDFYEWQADTTSMYRQRLVNIYLSNSALDQSELTERLVNFDRGSNLIKFHVHLKAWRDFLGILSNHASKTVAIELEQWVYRHYLSEKFTDAISCWWRVFIWSETRPEFLEPLKSDIDRYMNVEDSRQIWYETEKINDKYCDEKNFQSFVYADGQEWGEYMTTHRPPYAVDYSLLDTAFIYTRVTATLQLLARTLTPEQIQILVEWAENYFNADRELHGSPDRLCGKELISSKIFFADSPSILDVNYLEKV